MDDGRGWEIMGGAGRISPLICHNLMSSHPLAAPHYEDS